MRYFFLYGLLAAALIAAWNSAQASIEPPDLGIHLNALTIDYALFKDDSREPVIYPDVPKERLDLGIDIGFLKYGYFSNTVHSLTDSSQFTLIGWHYQIGVHVLDYADVYADHFSQHLLDKTGNSPYPVTNQVGVKFYLYRAK